MEGSVPSSRLLFGAMCGLVSAGATYYLWAGNAPMWQVIVSGALSASIFIAVIAFLSDRRA